MAYDYKDIPSLIPKLQIVATQVMHQEYAYQVMLDTIDFLKTIYLESAGYRRNIAITSIDDSNADYIGPYSRLPTPSLPKF